MSGLEDRFLTYLAVMLSQAGVAGLEDILAVVGGVVAVELLEPESVLEVLGFEWTL